jgi:hypothetical protein
MPLPNAQRHHRLKWCEVLLTLPTLVATCVVSATASAAEYIPRGCDDLSFKAIAQMMDAASNFETRLVLLGKSLVQERSVKHPADNDDGSTASEREEVNIGALHNALGEVWGYLLAAENLAAVRDLTVDDRDRSTVDRQFKLVAQQIQEPLSFGLETAENVSAKTQRPGMAAEVAKIHDFMDATRTQFAACAGRANHQ